VTVPLKLPMVIHAFANARRRRRVGSMPRAGGRQSRAVHARTDEVAGVIKCVSPRGEAILEIMRSCRGAHA
jgi:hypothetical protein